VLLVFRTQNVRRMQQNQHWCCSPYGRPTDKLLIPVFTGAFVLKLLHHYARHSHGCVWLTRALMWIDCLQLFLFPFAVTPAWSAVWHGFTHRNKSRKAVQALWLFCERCLVR